MNGFTIVLLGVIFVTLIAGSIQSITADHLEPGQGIFIDERDVNLRGTKVIEGVLGSPPDFYCTTFNL